ncbi:TetR/AcrR family transcriptional regulator [Mycobacterium sp. TKK-01-0059]|uniref:TetR/AcrR family transcriptional regulator n=1 Tax=Mycobacterium sp. TKK-01-0059 TaxID=1324269 RepID=UPI0015D00892|nr:TetR/AcrR family transcriptional regulator [Mycobacterium sp. TKK-01-0059]
MSVAMRKPSGAQTRTRSAILTATASVLARDRTATMPEIAEAASVGRTTLHRYFADREGLIHAATMDAIQVVNEIIADAATNHGPAIEAMRRVVAELVRVSDQIVFLFADPAVLRNIPPGQQPNHQPILKLIKRGQKEGAFVSDLSPDWIELALFALILRACRDSGAGAVPRHTVVASVIRIFEHGVTPR